MSYFTDTLERKNRLNPPIQTPLSLQNIKNHKNILGNSHYSIQSSPFPCSCISPFQVYIVIKEYYFNYDKNPQQETIILTFWCKFLFSIKRLISWPSDP